MAPLVAARHPERLLPPYPRQDLLESAFYTMHAARRTVASESDLNVAILSLDKPEELRAVYRAHPAPSNARLAAQQKALYKLSPNARSTLSAVLSAAKNDALPLLLKSPPKAGDDPKQQQQLVLAPTEASCAPFFATEALCKGLELPPEVNEPWRWSEWWADVLRLGAEIGPAFHRGLLKASCDELRVNKATGSELQIRARVGGHRSTALKAIGLLLRAVTTLDLRDNRLTDAEVSVLTAALSASRQLERLNVAGNRLTHVSAVALASVVLDGKGTALCQLDLSRNKLCGSDGREGSGLLALAATAGTQEHLHALTLSRVGLLDSIGAKMLQALANRWAGGGPPRLSEAAMAAAAAAAAPAATAAAAAAKPVAGRALATALTTLPTDLTGSVPPPNGSRMLTVLNLSHNRLGASFAAALPESLAYCPALAELCLAYNDLGVEGGKAVAEALYRAPCLRLLDLTSINLCGISPNYGGVRGEWSAEALVALFTALDLSTVNELVLHANGLCGLVPQWICGEIAPRGRYTSAGIDAMIAALERNRLPLHGLRGLRLEADNFVRRADSERLSKALKDTLSAPVRTGFESMVALTAAANIPGADGKGGLGGLVAAMRAAAHAEKAIATALEGAEEDDAPPAPTKGAVSGVGLPGPASAVPVKLDPTALPPSSAGDKGGVKAGVKAEVSGALVGSAAGVSGSAVTNDRAIPTGSEPGLPGAEPLPGGAEADETSKKGAKKGAKGNKTAKGKESEKAVKEAEEKAKREAEEKNVEEVEVARGGGKEKKSKKKKAGKEASEVELAHPFADKPVHVAIGVMVARETEAMDSAVVGGGEKASKTEGAKSKVLVGSLCRVVETVTVKDGVKRMLIALEGDSEPLGWVTGLTKDGQENLKLAAAAYPLMRVVKNMACREGKDPTSRKLEPVAKDMLVRVIESVTMPDGAEKACVAKDADAVEMIGWITVKEAAMEEAGKEALVPAPRLSITFDMKAHTASSLSIALELKRSGLGGTVVRKRGWNNGGLPFQIAGRRPTYKPDDGAPSRHTIIDTPATLVLCFNCFNAAFEVTSWSGEKHTPFDKLPAELGFDLVVKASKLRIGRVKLAAELGMPFLERVEFPDVWVNATGHGIAFDGWQGSGSIECELIWGKEIAKIRVHPWLAYACSIGARMCIRKLGAPSGQCATVQRILGDDRVVARVDGFSKLDGVRGETIVDLQPSTVVRTSYSGYARDTRILLVHHKKLVDATVLNWLGAFNAEEGAKHLVRSPLPRIISHNLH